MGSQGARERVATQAHASLSFWRLTARHSESVAGTGNDMKLRRHPGAFTSDRNAGAVYAWLLGLRMEPHERRVAILDILFPGTASHPLIINSGVYYPGLACATSGR